MAFHDRQSGGWLKAPEQVPPLEPVEESDSGNRRGIKQTTAQLKAPVYEQLRRLAFEEQHKMHDYLIAGLDRAFRSHRAKPSVSRTRAKIRSSETWDSTLGR